MGFSSLQAGGFGFCGDKDGDIEVGVFPEGEEIVVGGASLRGVAEQGIGAGKTKVRECAGFTRTYSPTMFENFLKLGGSSGALVCRELRLRSDVNGVQATSEGVVRQFIGNGATKELNALCGILADEFDLRANRG
jgi:hypothetical protein